MRRFNVFLALHRLLLVLGATWMLLVAALSGVIPTWYRAWSEDTWPTVEGMVMHEVRLNDGTLIQVLAASDVEPLPSFTVYWADRLALVIDPALSDEQIQARVDAFDIFKHPQTALVPDGRTAFQARTPCCWHPLNILRDLDSLDRYEWGWLVGVPAIAYALVMGAALALRWIVRGLIRPTGQP